MKKVLVIFVLLVYSFSLLGSHVNVHYCMNKIAGWSFLDDPSDKECGRCGMKNTHCCKTEIKENKATSEQISPVQDTNGFHSEHSSTTYYIASIYFSSNPYKHAIQINPHAPPLELPFDPFSSFCIFRI